MIAIAIPIERKYDKFFRFFSLKLIPPNVVLPSFFEKKIYVYPSDIMALGLLFIALFAFRISLKRFFVSRGAIFLWIVFLAAFVSILFSPLAHYPIPYIRLLQLATPFLLFCFLANACSEEEKSQLSSLFLKCLAFGALIQSGIAIAQYAIQGPLGLKLLGEPNSFPCFPILSGKHWLFDFVSNGESTTTIRSLGTFPHPNVLGGFLSISMLAIYSFFSMPRWRLLSALLIPIQFFAMSLTFSRSAFFSWILGTLIWFGLQVKKNGVRSIFRDQGVRLLFGSICTALIFSFLVLHEQISDRGGIVNYNEVARSSDAQRIYYQNVALEIIKDHPLQGAGFHQLTICALDYTSNDPNYFSPNGTHNIYLYLTAETGFFSLAAFLLFIFFLLRAALQSPCTPLLASLTAMFVAFLFIGGCDFYPLLFQQGKLPFFLAAGLLALNARWQRTHISFPIVSHSRENIWKMFDAISANYDRINPILSFGMDRSWRRRLASYLPQRKHLEILDLASGTGDQLIACFESGADIRSGTGIDLASEMLNVAKAKVESKPYKTQVKFQRADALLLPFSDNSFDAATFSFGIRNVPDPLAALKEIHRVLKPGGRSLILEFSLPPQPLKIFYLFYLRYILPSIGGFFSKNKAAYRYLNETIETFPCGNAFCLLMKSALFRSIRQVPMTLGAVTLYLGEKR